MLEIGKVFLFSNFFYYKNVWKCYWKKLEFVKKHFFFCNFLENYWFESFFYIIKMFEKLLMKSKKVTICGEVHVFFNFSEFPKMNDPKDFLIDKNFAMKFEIVQFCLI